MTKYIYFTYQPAEGHTFPYPVTPKTIVFKRQCLKFREQDRRFGGDHRVRIKFTLIASTFTHCGCGAAFTGGVMRCDV